MFVKTSKSLPSYQFSALNDYADAVDHQIFTRDGGASSQPFASLNIRYHIGDCQQKIISNRQLIAKSFRIQPQQLYSANQSHSPNIKIITANDLKEASLQTDDYNDIDALITQVPGVYLLIQTADCQAIILFDPQTKTIANIHCGWRGNCQNIVGQTVAKMTQEYAVKPQNIIAGIGPSLGPQSSEFINRVSEFPEQLHQFFLPNNHVDLWEITRYQLLESGLDEDNIHCAKIDTYSNHQEFFSYRWAQKKSQPTGRFATVIGLI